NRLQGISIQIVPRRDGNDPKGFCHERVFGSAWGVRKASPGNLAGMVQALRITVPEMIPFFLTKKPIGFSLMWKSRMGRSADNGTSLTSIGSGGIAWLPTIL